MSESASPKNAKGVSFSPSVQQERNTVTSASAGDDASSLTTTESMAFFNDPLPPTDDSLLSFENTARSDGGLTEGSVMVPLVRQNTMDASVASHLVKARSSDKSFVDVAAKEESRRMDEFDRTGVSLDRSVKFVPVNPFQGDATEMLDPLDDDLMGVELTEAAVQEREIAKAFEKVNHTDVECRTALGYNFNPNQRGSRCVTIAHVDEDSVCYPAGRHIHTAKLLDATSHRVLQRTPRCVEVMAFCISSNGKYIAISERMQDAPHVTIYKLDSSTRITSLSFKHLSQTQVVALDFSSNNSFIATLTASPTPRLIMWQLSDVKVIGVLDEPWIKQPAYPLPPGVSPTTAILSSLKVNPWSSFFVALGSDQGMSIWKLSGRVFNKEGYVSTVAPPFPEAAPQQQSGMMASHSGMTSSHNNSGASVPAHKPIRKVVDVCWYDETCCGALTEDGVFIAMEGGVVKQRLRLRQNGNPSSPTNVRRSPGGLRGAAAVQQHNSPLVPPMLKLAWASRGMLCCGEDGVVILIDRTYADPCFVQVAVLKLGSVIGESSLYPAVQSVSVSPAETNVVFGLSDNTVVCVTMDQLNDAISEAEEKGQTGLEYSLDIPAGNTSAAPLSIETAHKTKMGQSQCVQGCGVVFGDLQPFSQRIEHLCFHSQPVTSLSTCIQRPIIATTSSDMSLRIYDYEAQRVVLFKKMEDELFAGALHPTGLYIVLCFRFYTRVYAILPHDLHLVEDLNLKPCHEVRFSNTGGRIAFAVNNRVIIYDAHTYRIVGGLVGHMSNVKSIHFSPRDEIITTCDVAGIILTWNAETFERTPQESSQKNLIFQQAFLHQDTGLFCGFGSSKHARGTTYEGEVTFVCCKPGDDTIVYVRPGMILPKAQATRKPHYQLMTITRTSSTLIAATPTGRLLLYTWPLLKSSKPYLAVDTHLAEITHILVTQDERYLFTVGADCCLAVYDLLHMREGKYVSAVQFNYSLFEPVLLRHVTDSDQLDRDIFALRRRISDKKADNARALESIRKSRELDIGLRAAAFASDIERLRRDIEAVTSAMHNHEKVTADRAMSIEKQHATSAEEIEVLYSKRAREALARIDKIELEREELAAQYEAKIASKRNEGIANRNRLETLIAERERALQATIAENYKKLQSSVREQEAMFAQTVADYETQLMIEEKNHAVTVATATEQTQKAATTATFGDREAERLRREIVDVQQEVSVRKERYSDLTAVLQRKDKENKVLKAELLEKQETINQTENRMLLLKQQLSKLENLRFVLTHQYEELRRAYIPKDGQIRDLEHRMRDMEQELQSLSFERNQVRDFVMATDERLNGLNDESARLRVQAIDQDRRCKVFVDEIGRLLDTFTDGIALKRDLTAAVQKGYKTTKIDVGVLEASKREASAMDARNAELHGITDYLNAKLSTLQRQEKTYDKKMMDHNRVRITQHTSMIEEIRAMRDERKEILTRCNFAEQQLRDACVALHRLSDPRRLARLDLVRAPPQDLLPLDPLPPPPPLLPPIERALVPVADSPVHTREGAVSAPPTVGKGSSNFKTRKGLPSPGKGRKAKNAAATVFERTQLQQMIDQLDHNTAVMRHQQHEVAYLRDVVQVLLQDEEARLLHALRDLMPSSASGGTSPPRAAQPDRPDSFVGPTPGLDDDGVDWSPTAKPNQGPGAARAGSSGSRAASGRPMTPTQVGTAGLQ